MAAESVREHYRREGELRERERIIALLQAELNYNCALCGYDGLNLIALIKGETE